jgi:HSP20 family protein
MSMTNWNANREMTTLREAMNRLFEDSVVWNPDFYLGGTNGTREARLPIDAYTTDDEIVVTAVVPGVNPEEVEITYEGDTLTIKGKTSPRQEGVSYIFTERFHGSFMRTLQLNVPVDADKIDASFENGILTLVLPKAEAVKPRVIKVKTAK